MSKRSAIEDIYPLAPLQEGMLFHALYAPESGVYVGQFGFVLEGPLDADALERAWQGAVGRHEVLRAGFAWEGMPRPVQVIRREAKLSFRREDWREPDEAGRHERLERYLAEDRARGFELKQAPLMRLALFRVGDEEHHLVWTHHHLILDGWSLSLLFRDVLAFYAAHLRGTAPLAGAGRRYRDYVAWLERQDRAAAERYWRRALAGFGAATPLPAARARKGDEAGVGEAALLLPVERTGALREQARRAGVTLSTLVQGAWALLLSRYAGEEDVVFGATVSGRPAELPGVEETVGMFINTLPVRARLSADTPLGEWLAQLQGEQAEAREHEYAPLVDVQRWSGVPAGEPLFESLVVFENYPIDQALGEDAGLLGGLRVRIGFGREQATYPLVLTAYAGTRLRAELRYDRARVDAEAAERLAGHLEALLEAMAADPRRRLREVSLLRDAERAQLRAWNPAPVELPQAPIHELFAEQASRSPDAPAVLSGEEVLSYSGLERGANRLAHLLAERGVGPEARVALVMERGIPAVTAMLGILKAGGAYVPLDPSSPTERLREIFADAGVSLVLTDARAEARLPGDAEALWLNAPETAAALAAMPATAPAVPADPRQLAYVVYTSGSTGRPKGVAVSHVSVVRLVRETDYVPFGPAERIAHASNLAFDAATFEVWGALLGGGSLVVVEREVTLSPAAFAALLREQEVSALFVITALFNRIAGDQPGAFATLRHLLFGGEAVDPQSVRSVLERGAPGRLLHVYGPTETTTFATWQPVRRVEPGAATVPIGGPLANTTLHVLDAWGEPLPAGVPGELYVGGPGVARGYLGRPELTAERFVPDALGTAGGRLYRTGDRVRWNGDGAVEYLGRLDAQVKVRGFRIEPGEIEARLREMPGIRDAAVVAREDTPGDRRLVAYVVPEEGAEVGPAGLRAELRARLPEYMVPGAFVVLERLPLNANGKVDRRALPAPEHGSAEAYVAPRTATEEVLAGIWAEVLGAGRVGVEDGFFELGGHSLLATQVVSRARKALGVEVPVRDLFEAPTVAALAARVEALRSAGASPAPPLARVPRRGGEGLPLSFAQQRLWFVDRLEPGSSAYNMPVALRLRGALGVAALRASLDELARRHETLRTTFAEHDGMPVQVVRPPAPTPLPLLDLGRLPEARRRAEAERLAAAEAVRPFDLARGPLLRATLLRLGDDDHVLCFTLHHVVSDGWSMQVLTREVSALYAAFSRGEAPRLPELPVQYADYAVWQREWLRGEALEARIGFWKEQLAGAPPLLEIPTDRPRAAGQGRAAARHAFALPPELSQGLRTLARREGATLFMTLLAAWQALLAKYSGGEDVVVGTPIAGRTRTELEGLIGFFVNMLPLRADLAGDPTWSELLGRVREAALGAYAHQELPFERLVDEMGVERSLLYTPVFQSAFALDRSAADGGRLELGGLGLEPFGGGEGAAKFDLDLALADSGGALAGGLVYREALFEAATIARMAGHLEAVLEALAAAPARRLSELSLLRGGERAQLLAGSRAEPAAHSPARVHELFSAQAARTPGLTAVQGGGETLTYAELERRSNRLAHHLRSRGVGPEVRVGICLERGAEMLVAVLGVLKAGGAYVPLDPAYPAERLAYTLADSGAALLVAQSALLATLPPFAGEVVRLDADREAIAGQPDGAVEGGVEVRDAAYVIYTSGSTGLPKGVVVEHAGLANTLLGTRDGFGLDVGGVMPALASPAFDIWGFEVFSTLLAGGQVRLPSLETIRDVERLVEDLEDVDAVHAVPALMREIVARVQAGPGTLPRMRRVFVGGDAVPPDLIGQMRRVFPAAELRVLYGPTEATILAAASRLRAEGGYAWQVVGSMLPGVGLYVCDDGGSLLPAGVAGELWIGGAGVARGYQGRAELTAARFVPDPFSAEAGARAYRTGDRVRRRADGELEFLGRTDRQVKIRGFRVEPGEVEAALLGQDGVREAVSTVREDAPGQRRLVAYVVAGEGAELSPAALKARLQRQVPEHMVPGAIVVLERLPLTLSGKVDRRALPAPEHGSAEAYVAPRTPAEEVLAGIWAEVLHLERVGVDQDFFGLGGHSLLATQVVSRARRAFGVEVPLRALFEAPTVAALARRVDALRSTGAAAAPPVVPVPRTEPLPLSFAQQRLWVVDRLEPGSAAYNMPAALRLRGALDTAALRAAIGELARRHEALRTTFAEHGGAPVQVIHPAAPVPLPTVDLRGAPDPEGLARRLAAAEALRPFDLARGPLLRSTLLRLGEEEHVLLFTLHHVVSDAWSMDVLTREVSASYAAFSRGEAPRLPELPVQYADFAVWQREWLRGRVLEERIGFWKARLAGAPPLLEIPTDRPRRAGQSPREASHRVALSPEASDGLRALARREGATLFMTVLAAWQALLGRYAGMDDVVVGTPVAGRSRLETEGLIGFFVNMLALRADLSGDPTWAALLARTREATLGAFAHQELPFERLVEELGAERSLAHSPVFQAAFALHRAGDGERPSPGGLELEAFGGAGGVAKFDLDLAMLDGGGALDGALVYRPALFDAATIERMAGHLETVLEAMAADPLRPSSALSLLGEAERARVLEEWNDTGAGYAGGEHVHDRFARQARLTPGAAALRHGAETLTYGELERAANRLAQHLRALGVGPETRVGICLERGTGMVVATLAVLKAGGAYLPLDPSYPAERLAYMLEDAAPAVLLTREALLERLPRRGAAAVCLDRDAAEIARRSDAAPAAAPWPESLAYVIYTSGSTGRPKGVEVTHRGLGNYLAWAAEAYAGEGHGAPVHSSLSFDLTVTSLLVPLVTGGRVVLTDEGEGVEGLARALREEPGFTLVKLTPAHLPLLAEQLSEAEAAAAARTLVVGGEALPAELAAYWRRVAPGTEVVNEYGPTETVVGCAVHRVPGGGASGGSVPIGRPIAGTRVYVAGAGMLPSPVGVPGELLVGGAGVARGYLGRPELTAEKFVPDGFSAEAGGRLYRTGDRARWRADGELEFLGRVDAQVKVRGFRIEPGEIEAALLEGGGVREAVVVVREDAPGQRRLVAYVVAEEGAEPSAGELRARLASRLPEHMVPAAFVMLESIPLTGNGKTDRRALPAPEHGADAERVAPRTATEEVLAGIWAETLRVERVGVEEGFFELGGHSLLATQVVSRAREAFGVEVPLRTLFEAPTVAALAERVDALRGAGAPAAPPIRRVSREAPLPLSFAQQRLWFIDRMEPGSAAYNMPYALRLRGALDTGALRASLDALVARHETLRTTFAEGEGGPVQVVHAPAPVALAQLDLRGLPEAEREPAARRLAGEEALRPFDLAIGPLLRSTLLRLGEEDHVLCFTLHHVVSDGWSRGVLTREVSALYAAFARGEAPRLPELPVQYADFAVWQREWLRGETLDEQVGFWKAKLRGAPPLLEIPTDRPRGAGQIPRVASHVLRLPPGLSQELRALSRREGVTLFMTLLAGWQALLGRWAGQDDLVVGSPVAGRSRRETEGLIGFFVNMLALRADLSGDPTWAGLLGRVREEALGAYAHQELPFERLVEELHVERSLAHSPVFQTTFTLDLPGGGGERLELGDLVLEPFGRGDGLARFDLDLVFAEAGDALAGELVFRAALFDAATIGRMAGHLEVLLEALAADPRRRPSEVSLLTGAERARVVQEWNATAADFARGSCIHELVAARAARTPDAVAVAAGGRTLTYAELERRSDRLAGRLAALGVRPETRVGLCLERGAGMVVAMLGILKAGGAYLPLDPSYPAERLAYMLGDSGASVLLTQQSLSALFQGFGGEVVFLDGIPAEHEDAEDEDALSHSRNFALSHSPSPENAAYVIYTSGSTGRPKGVAVPHRAVVNFLQSMRARPGLSAADTLLAVTTLSFDIAALELFLPLTTGARVVVADREAASDGARLREAIAASGATVMQATPASWRMLLEAGWEGTPGLRALCGGEALPCDLAERIAARCAELWNLYGPTETTVWSTAARVEPGADAVSLGGPIANTRVYLLDAGGEPVPVGVAGELYVGGEGVARGYPGRPELTAAQFVPDAFSAVAGGRLYRTGDRARWRADGELEFLGRVDAQVKIRGFRIEPGEVEAALRALPRVREAVAVVREVADGDRRLVAYVVPGDGAPVTAAELRAGLRERLPEHMVPGAFVVLESLPLTASGKVDRRALPTPEPETAAHVAPRTATEEVLAGIWAETLRVERVGVEASFFELGGHSLLATRVVSRVRQALGVELPLRALFEAPTVAALAGRVEALRSAGAPAAPPIRRVPREAPLPLSFGQQRLWLVDRMEPGSAAYNMPYALRLRGALDTGALRASLDALVARHETLRTTFADGVGGPVQVVHAPAPVALAQLDLRDLPEAEREPAARRLAGEEALRPFDLAQGPLLRSTLLRLGEEDHVLCFTLHHVVSDGWSMQVLTREVSALYTAFVREEEPRLPELPVQYADFAVWQREWLSGETLEAQVAFWRERLAGAPPLLEVPTDRPRAVGLSPRAATHRFVLTDEVSDGLRALARARGATLFMTLLAAWQALLGRWAGQDDLVVGSAVAGRTRGETEGLIGFFVNMLALRADLSGDPNWSELVGRVRETALGAYAHQDLPFERLVEELAAGRSLAHAPVFQAAFALEQAAGGGERLRLGELAPEPFGGGGSVARFDLDLVLADTGGALAGEIVYRAALFDAATIGRMAGHLEAMLGAMAADPRRRLAEAPLLAGAERARVLEAWNATAADFPGERCVHELFAGQAARTPGAVAVVFEGRALTYAELDERSSRLAHHLRGLGVGPDARVGVCLERGVELVVAVLAVLKAGGAYVPLDPAHPAERLLLVLDDAGARAVVTAGEAAGRLAGHAGPVVRLDADAERIAREPAGAPAVATSPRNLAYLIYTSGSTGRPKGVMVEHRSVANLYAALERAVYAPRGAAAPPRVSVNGPATFDTSVKQLVQLLGGATLCMVPEPARFDADALAAYLRAHAVEVLDCTPAQLRHLLADGLLEKAGPALTDLLVAGEAIDAELWRTLAGLEGRRAWNLYGPTECTVDAALCRVSGARPVLGGPISNARLFVLDAAGAPLPVGVPGELYVGGAGVARGYAGQPAATAARFVPDPFSGEAGARLYRTGDRVRWLADGELEYLGRLDDQVKVRGFRIEPGEIEAVLLEHAGVREAAVVAREDAPGAKRLVACVVPEEGAEPPAAELRAHLAARLPDYMVPAAFVALERLPLSPNGKTDRRALLSREFAGGTEYAPPETAMEELVCGLWLDVLGSGGEARHERVGIHDSFFELGGHSLLATQVVARLSRELGIEVPLQVLFESPTAAAFAARVEDLYIMALDDSEFEARLSRLELVGGPDEGE